MQCKKASNTADYILDVISDTNQIITMDDVASAFSLAVNLSATMLIAFKAWYVVGFCFPGIVGM